MRSKTSPSYPQLTQMDTSKPLPPRRLKGTLNFPLPSPNDLFEKEQAILKTLYPQNYAVKKPRKTKEDYFGSAPE